MWKIDHYAAALRPFAAASAFCLRNAPGVMPTTRWKASRYAGVML
jgi:hypothetical protein